MDSIQTQSLAGIPPTAASMSEGAGTSLADRTGYHLPVLTGYSD